MHRDPNASATSEATEHRFHVHGRVIRVVVWRDVIAVPSDGWSLDGFGAAISEEWLLTQPRPRLPGNAERRRALARAIRQALGLHHGYEVAS